MSNLGDSGAGSLRQAIVETDESVGLSTIDFDVAGTIRISSTSLPPLTNPVIIDGSTAPAFPGRRW